MKYATSFWWFDHCVLIHCYAVYKITWNKWIFECLWPHYIWPGHPTFFPLPDLIFQPNKMSSSTEYSKIAIPSQDRLQVSPQPDRHKPRPSDLQRWPWPSRPPTQGQTVPDPGGPQCLGGRACIARGQCCDGDRPPSVGEEAMRQVSVIVHVYQCNYVSVLYRPVCTVKYGCKEMPGMGNFASYKRNSLYRSSLQHVII